MKKLILTFIAILISTVAFCAVPDSTVANMTGEILGGLYNYAAPSLSITIKQSIATIVTVTPMILLALQIVFKKIPQLEPIDGWLGFILDTLTWYVKNTSPVDSGATNDLSKKN